MVFMTRAEFFAYPTKQEVKPVLARFDPSQAASMLSALGASKGGKARAEALTPEQRNEIAQKAANARWKKKEKE